MIGRKFGTKLEMEKSFFIALRDTKAPLGSVWLELLISVSVKFQKFFDANLSVTIQIGLCYDFIDLFL